MGIWPDCFKLIFASFFRAQKIDKPGNASDKARASRPIASALPRRNSVLLLCLPLFLSLSSTTTADEWVYTMQSGDNLWDLSKEHLDNSGNWLKLQKLNNITDPKRIPPGTPIHFPLAWLKIKPAPVRILEFVGEVNVTSSLSGVAIILKPGITLTSGDEIHTGANGNVLLEFLDRSQLLLQKNSHLIIERQNVYGSSGVMETRVRLLRGRVETRVIPAQKNGTRFEIHTPAAITGVRGTDFRVAMAPDLKVGRTEVTHGKVAVSGSTGEAVTVPENSGIVVTVGQPPSPPKPLLLPPDLSLLPNHTTRFPLTFEWPAIEGAELYRAQISHASAAALLVDEAGLVKPQLNPIALPDGDYLLRVRAIDSDGLEGLNTAHKFKLVVPIEPPLLTTPSANTTMQKQPASFHWEAAENSATFHFQLSTRGDFSTLIIDRPDHQKTQLNLENRLEYGDYYWRVASRTTFGKQSAFSPTQQFSLQPQSNLAWMLFFLPLLLLL